MTVLHCHGLSVEIGDTRVVSELSLEVSPGQFWGLMGANGSGKTTLMRCLAGLTEPAAGYVALDGQPLAAMPRRAVARHLGMLQQHTVYVFDASVLQTALTGRHPHIGPWGRESAADIGLARQAIRTLDLETLEHESVTRLSGGEARRLAFATLLVQQPEIMLLDEPSNHLDLRYQVKIMRRIGDEVYGRGRMAIAATHEINLAACYCSHILMLFGEGEWHGGPAAAMLTTEKLEHLYQCPVDAIQTPAGKRFHPSFGRVSA